ncbi:MAG TPA: hypothetical protein VG649_09790 [Candidatus Angelobacter sp.]|nr:hypothetical protein [Candidatus Angelobacter sp.]
MANESAVPPLWGSIILCNVTQGLAGPNMRKNGACCDWHALG